MSQPRTHREPITLRTGDGSHRVVREVHAFDTIGGVVFVRFEPSNGYALNCERVPLERLEALDADRRYVRPVSEVVRSMVDEAAIFE